MFDLIKIKALDSNVFYFYMKNTQDNELFIFPLNEYTSASSLVVAVEQE